MTFIKVLISLVIWGFNSVPVLLIARDTSWEIRGTHVTIPSHLRTETTIVSYPTHWLRIFSWIKMLIIIFSDDPTTESRAHCYCNLWTPFNQSFTFHHASKLHRCYPQLVNLILKLFKLLINQVHNVLLTLCGICQALVVSVLLEVIVIGKNTSLNISRYP